MLLPIGDDDSGLSGPALVTWGLILANVFVYFFLQSGDGGEAFTYGWSVVPREITQGIDLVEPQTVALGGERVTIPQAPGPSPIYLTILSALFMHGGLMHLLGNLLYLWIFGDNVEHRFGCVAFLLFYLASGIAATFAQIALDPARVMPNLGASGAISGVLGAWARSLMNNSNSCRLNRSGPSESNSASSNRQTWAVDRRAWQIRSWLLPSSGALRL